MQVDRHIRVFPRKAGLIVADVADRETGQMGQFLVRDRIGATGFPGQHDAVGGDEGFTGHARLGVGGKERVEHRIADPIGDLVRMTFRNRFGGKQKLAFVAHNMPQAG